MLVSLVLAVLIINAFVDVIAISIVNKDQDALTDSVFRVINALVMKYSDHVPLLVNQVASNEIMLAQLNAYPVDANAIMALFVIVLAIVFHLINASKIIFLRFYY